MARSPVITYDQMHVRDRFSPPNLHYLAGHRRIWRGTSSAGYGSARNVAAWDDRNV